MGNPIEVSPTSTTPDRRRFQFSLRTLLELTAVASLGCSLWAWGGKPVSRMPEFFAGVGSVLVVLGIYKRRWTWIIGGLLVLIWLLIIITIWNPPHQAYVDDLP
jgi:hypothetical protein